MKRIGILAAGAAILSVSVEAGAAAELEVTHWWTSGAEAAAVRVLADAFDATGDHWIDAAIGGGGPTAIATIVARITGGNPPGATLMVHGRQAEELVQAGLMRDLTELAEREGWRNIVNPPSLLDACTYDGRIYCVPTNIHSQQWLWLSAAAFSSAGIAMPKDWNEFVAAAPALEAAGIIPVAMGPDGFQSLIAFNTILASVGGPDLYIRVYGERDPAVLAGPEVAAVFEALATYRAMAAQSRVGNWNEATNLLITGKAAGQIMGDWAQAEFVFAGLKAGEDYDCLPGLGLQQVANTGGNAFYFPRVDDPAITEAQLRLASLMISPEVQVAFNTAKGSMPVRGDVDLASANVCMQRGLEILAHGTLIPAVEQLITPDTQNELRQMLSRFFADPGMTPEAAQAELAAILSAAD